MSDYYLLKMEVINEFKRAARLIEANRETMEILMSTLDWVNRFCEENSITPPNSEKIIGVMDKIQALLSDDSYHGDDADAKLPEP